MKKIISAATACILSVCSLFSNISIKTYAQESFHSSIETFTNGFMKVETGDIYEDIVKYINFGYDLKYDIYVQTDGKNVGMKSYAFVPLYNYAEFILSETADIEETEGICIPIMKKYNTFTFYFATSSENKKGYCKLKKLDEYTDEEFAHEVEMLMEELRDTGYFYEYYPPGSLNNVTWISGNFEFFGVNQKEAILKYINENLENYSLTDGGMLIPDENLTIQERFDVVQQIYNDIGIKTSFATVDLGYDFVGNSIKLNGETQPSITTTIITVPVETTTTTVSTTTPIETTTATETTVITTVSTTNEPTTTTTTITEPIKITGDADGNGKLDVRDAAFIASALANGTADELPESADYNEDEKINVRDAAAIAQYLAEN